MDEIIPYIKTLDKDVIAILLTAFFGIFAWLVKTFIVDPVEKSRETFEANLDNRIRINTEVKNVLSFLLLVDDKQKPRDQLQVILTRDGATAYLDRKVLADIIRIALDEQIPDQEITQVINPSIVNLIHRSTKLRKRTGFIGCITPPDPCVEYWLC